MEQKKNPQAVLDVLNWFDNSSKQRPSSKYMTHGMHNNTTHSGMCSIIDAFSLTRPSIKTQGCLQSNFSQRLLSGIDFLGVLIEF